MCFAALHTLMVPQRIRQLLERLQAGQQQLDALHVELAARDQAAAAAQVGGATSRDRLFSGLSRLGGRLQRFELQQRVQGPGCGNGTGG